MELNLRKFVVGLLVLAALILAYSVYARFTNDPVIPDEDDLAPIAGIEDASGRSGNDSETDEDPDTATIRKTRFVHKTEGQIDREFGFEVLKNPEEDQWTLTNPYMKLFTGDFNCFITADKGQAQVDVSMRETMPEDIMFSGNVVVRLISLDPNQPEELFVYLDDVAFIGEESRFSTSGSVKFLSRVAQLEGRGMELIYDEPLGRLDLFRIKDLDTLRIRSDEFDALSDEMEPQPTAQEAPEAAGVEDDVQTEPEPSPAPTETAVASEPEKLYYRCVFYRNVTIRTPKESITARRQFAINNIFWSDSESESEPEPRTEAEAPAEAEPKTDDLVAQDTEPVETAPEPNTPKDVQTSNPNALDTTASKSLDLDAIPQSFFDVVVTCDGGFVIAPRDQFDHMTEPNVDTTSLTADLEETESLQEAMNDPNRSVVLAQSVDINFEATDTTLAGPVTITLGLDPNDLTGQDPDADLMPVHISVRKTVRYFSADNEVLLEGPCTVALKDDADPNDTRQYTLSAPMLRLALMEDPNADPKGPGITLRQFTASGGPIAVRAKEWAGDELVRWFELRAGRMDYSAEERTFAVLRDPNDPGEIRVHNSQLLDPEADPNDMLNRPCYVFMRNFDSLTYTADANEIVAAVNTGVIQIDYLPRVEGVYGRQSMQADVGRIAIKLAQAKKGKELASITASDGIAIKSNGLTSADEMTYECFGSTLFYDHNTALVTILGDELQPCYFNGASVDEVEIDTVTGGVKAVIRGPSTLQTTP